MAEHPAPGAPPEQVGHYRILERLGEGGMGVVYLAFDTDLGRRVALKWLRQATPATIERLRQEAHLHARVEHPAVCRVYDVGEWEGWPYLVMQLIQGRTLDRLAPELDLATKLSLMATLADGVHAAHRQGLIHRDLKPSNLMVEADEAGTWRPYVMDFGLAKDEASGSLTEAGALLGSPAYMAPEQVGGGWVDLRTDVYGLGASLFELVAGRPPFAGPTGEVLLQVQTQDPPSLRKLIPGLPRDLDTVVHTCLAKDPARRYSSAAAFRDDLQRLLHGQPVKARRVSPLERLGLWMRRNRLASVLTALAAVSLLATGLVWDIGQRRAQTRAYWAERFGQEAIRMDNAVRFGRMLPPHDLAREFSQVRQRMEDVRLQMARAPLSRGPGRFTLGAGFLLLGDSEAARPELEQAWNLGHRSPQVALALGLCLTDLYEKELAASQGILDPKARDARQAQIRRELHDRARDFFARAKADRDESFSRVEETRLALADQRFDEAARLAQAAYDAEPWRYEAIFYLAKALAYRGREALFASRPDAARADFERVLELMENPLRIGTSDDRIQDVLKFVWSLGADLKLRGLDRRASLERALDASEALRNLNSTRTDTLNTHAMALVLLGKELARLGQDPEPYFQRAETEMLDVTRAPLQGPGSYPSSVRAKALERLANLAYHRAGRALQRHQDPRSLIQGGLRICQQAIDEHLAQWETYQNRGFLNLSLAEDQRSRGEESLASLEAAAQSLRDCANLNPSAPSWSNLAEVLDRLAQRRFDRGEDPEAALVSVREAARQSLALAPKSANASGILGDALLLEARWLHRSGKDPLPALSRAEAAYERARSLDGTEAAFPAGLAFVHGLRAEALRTRHEDPSAEARIALDTARRAIALKSEQGPELERLAGRARRLLSKARS